MSRPEVVPFGDEHLDGAATLLAARHARHREAEPLLAERYEDAVSARVELELAWRADGASGAAALRDERLTGFLVGAPREQMWGENVWVEAAGHAVEPAEDVRDLYALAAESWVEQGNTRHYALVPAHDAELLDAWWRIGFGQQQAHGIREVPSTVEVSVPDGFEIRPPRKEDVELLIDVDVALPDHQRASPVFHGIPWSRDDSREEWERTLAADEETILIGWHGSRPVACWSFSPAEGSRAHSGLTRPDHACTLGFAATVPDARGSGIGVALTQAGLAWAADEGYPVMLTDWRMTNLLASRFWPRRGFRTSFLRLYRSIP